MGITLQNNPNRVLNNENLDEILDPKCDGNSINYSIYANLTKYLLNENNIDGRDIYNSLDDLKNKKIGIYSPTYRDNLGFQNLQEFEDKDELVRSVITHIIDGGILFDGLANTVQTISNFVSKFPGDLLSVELGFGLKKGNTKLQGELNDYIRENKEAFNKSILSWDLINTYSEYLDTKLEGNNGVLNVIAKNDSSPYCYRRIADNVLIGAEIDFIYKFARKYGYKINIIEAITYDEQYKALRENNADIALGFFVIKKDDSIAFTDPLYKGTINLIVRYGNIPESVKWTTLYNSVKEFDGEKIGIQEGTFYDTLSKETLPNAEFITKASILDSFNSLLFEEINGFIFDQPIIEYFERKFPWRITYYTLDEVEPYNNAFAFQKNSEGEALSKEFNEFLKTINVQEIYNKYMDFKWVDDEYNININDYLNIDTELDPNGKLLNVGLNFDSKPLSFLYGNEPKGVDVEILYKFAKEKGYNLNITKLSLGERTTYIQEGKVNITGGSYSITEDRKKIMIFSDPLYEIKTALCVRTDSKKDKIMTKVEGEDHMEKIDNNIINVNVKFEDKIKNSSCTFPEYYKDEVILNCTIPDIKDVDVTYGFEYVNSNDKIKILYNDIEVDNFLQANTKLKDVKDIIKVGDTRGISCPLLTSSSSSNFLTIGLTTIVIVFIAFLFI